MLPKTMTMPIRMFMAENAGPERKACIRSIVQYGPGLRGLGYPWVRGDAMDEQSWEAVHSELLYAVAHALGTRITTVASVAQFLQGDSPRVAQFGSLLDAEASRL